MECCVTVTPSSDSGLLISWKISVELLLHQRLLKNVTTNKFRAVECYFDQSEVVCARPCDSRRNDHSHVYTNILKTHL